MEIRSLYLISYFIIIAFVMAWLIRLGLAFYYWSRKAGFYRLLAGQRLSLKPLKQNLPWNNFLLAISGLVFGWVVISWAGDWFVREWLLLILSGLAILSNELRLSKKDVQLLAVMALIAGLHDQREVGLDVFERLARIVDGLPPGEVQKAAREALQRRRSGFAVEQSCQTLSGLNPFLDELVFTLGLTSWQASPAFDLSLERLVQRAGKQWDRISRWMVFREQIQPFSWFSQMAILAALLYLIVEDIPAFTLAWSSYAVIGWIGLGCILLAGILFAAQNRAWLRRLVGSGLLVASVVPLWQYASLPRLFELQLNSVTHISEQVSYKKADWERIQVSDTDSKFPNPIPEYQATNNAVFTLPTATPAFQTMVDVRSQIPSLPSPNQEEDHPWAIPCCQPR